MFKEKRDKIFLLFLYWRGLCFTFLFSQNFLPLPFLPSGNSSLKFFFAVRITRLIPWLSCLVRPQLLLFTIAPFSICIHNTLYYSIKPWHFSASPSKSSAVSMYGLMFYGLVYGLIHYGLVCSDSYWCIHFWPSWIFRNLFSLALSYIQNRTNLSKIQNTFEI